MKSVSSPIFVEGKKLVKPVYFYLKGIYDNYRFHFNFQINLRKREAILVQQMGKVGSTALVESLEDLKLDIPVYHTHVLNHGRLENILKRIKLFNKPHYFHFIGCSYVRQTIDKGLTGKKWKVITIIREPISRNISAFFQNINWYFPNFPHRYKAGEIRIEELIDVFLNNNKESHDLPLKWLDLEIKDVFGIDVFSSDFPKSTGYKIFRGDNVDLLLLRLENLSECSPDAFKEFLGLEDFTLNKANLAEKKNYYDAYKNFKEAIVLPDWYIEKMYTSKYIQHFYSEDEISMFRAKWLKHTSEN